MNKKIGLAILAVVVLIVVFYQFSGKGKAAGGGNAAVTTVKGPVGGEKIGLLQDEEIRKILRNRYSLAIDYSRAGSIEMVRGSVTGQDFLWPSSQIALELFKEKGGKYSRAEVLFNSPIVIYTRQPVTEALIREGIVQKVNDAYYIVDSLKLVRMISSGKQWKEIGLPQLYGRILVFSTDPARSNSGNMFAGLLANLLNDGEVVDEAGLGKVMPDLTRFFGRLGYMQGSSGELFTQFLQQGIGSYPAIVGYEAQLLEFSIENAQYRDLLRKEISTLYPRPTVWSSHPLIALTGNGEKLVAALQDREIQRLAWERHGFRSGMLGVQNDPKLLQVGGVPATIENVIPMPRPRVMERIIEALSSAADNPTP